MKTILGIFRAACYSPGMVERDEAILRAAVERLEDIGYSVKLVHEEQFTPDTPMPDIVLHMARSPRVLDLLQRWHEMGCVVINSVKGVRNVERATLAGLCATKGVTTPKTWIVPTSSDTKKHPISFPCWVKRTGTCTQTPDDVCYITNKEEYERCMSNFHARGIHKVVIMEHLEGPCIKFYAIRGTGFFYCRHAYDKWSPTSSEDPEHETIAKHAKAISYSLQPLTKEPTEIPAIYGGDAIIVNGTAHIIDLNDWPSFAACREEAAKAIAMLVSKASPA